MTQTSAFKTLTPSQTFSTTIYEAQGGTYGVGMPIILYFNHARSPTRPRWSGRSR